VVAPPDRWRSLLATPHDRLDHARRLVQSGAPVPAEAVADALLDCTAEAVRLFRRLR